MEKILFVTLDDVRTSPTAPNPNSGDYIFSNVKTMPFEHLELRQLPEQGERFIVSIHAGSRLLYQCISSFTDKANIVECHDAVVYAKLIERVGNKP